MHYFLPKKFISRIFILFIFCIFICLFLCLLDHSFNSTGTIKDEEKCERLHGNIFNFFKNLTTPTVIVSPKERPKLSFKDLVVVSFASLNHIGETIRSCDTFQQHPQLKNTTFIMYLADNVTVEVQKIFASLCPVAQLQTLDLKIYPKYVQDLQQYRFKAIYQALTLKRFKVVLNIDASVRFVKSVDFNNSVKTAIKNNPTDVTLLSAAGHNMLTTIHPSMYNCFPNIKISEMLNLAQYQSGIILWIASNNGWRVMKRFVECALQRNCMAPPGAKKSCKHKHLYQYPDKFSGCHRFDQAAINLILYEESKHSPSKYQWSHPGFIVQRSSRLL